MAETMMTSPTATPNAHGTSGRTYRTAWRIWTGLVFVPVLLAAISGSWIIVDDLQTSGEFLDGVGVVIGAMMVGLAAISLVLVGSALLVSARSPRGALILSGIWMALAGMAAIAILGASASAESLPYAAGSLLYLAGFISLSSTVNRWPAA